MSRLNCKYFAFRLFSSADFEKVKAYLLQQQLNGLCIESQKICVFSKQDGTLLRFRKGINTLSKNMGLTELPKRIMPPTKRGDVLAFVVKNNAEAFRNGIGVETYGTWTISFCIKRYLKQHKSSKTKSIQLNNEIIASEGAIGAVKKNVMDYCTALKQEQAFKQITEELGNEAYCKKDVPNGNYITVNFAPYGQFDNSVEGRSEAEKYSKTVKIVSYLGEGLSVGGTVTRKKHYVIYSNSSAWGKSTFANMLVKKYNAQCITHVNNFCGIRENIQFLILDEYSGGFSDENLKLITSGDASTFTGNRKSHGRGWTPRPDLQLIFLMNCPLFAYHGKFNNKMQSRMVDQSLRDTFSQRFIHIKLDSTPIYNEEIDIIKYCVPSILTHVEQMKYFAYLYHKLCITQKENRLNYVQFCCGDNIETLQQIQYSEAQEDLLDKQKFISKLHSCFPGQSKTMLKIHMFGLAKYIQEHLCSHMELSQADLRVLHLAIDSVIS